MGREVGDHVLEGAGEQRQVLRPAQPVLAVGDQRQRHRIGEQMLHQPHGVFLGDVAVAGADARAAARAAHSLAGASLNVGALGVAAICRRMEAACKERRYEGGALKAIEEITALLARHFPPRGDNPDELSDKPVVL